jgi:hypothetical protein
MWEHVVVISVVVGGCWSLAGLAWQRIMYERVPVPMWRYAVGHFCFMGFIATMLELDGKTFQFWHGIVLIALFSGSLLSNSIRYKRFDDRDTGVPRTSVPSR